MLGHYTAAIRVLRYLKNTAEFKLHYEKSSERSQLIGSTDADWAECRQPKKPVGGCIFYGSTKEAIAWQAKGQPAVALPTLEAEYIAASDATREAIWLRRLSTDLLSGSDNDVVKMGRDNQAALNLIKTGVIRAKTKHIDVKFHHVLSEQQNNN